MSANRRKAGLPFGISEGPVERRRHVLPYPHKLHAPQSHNEVPTQKLADENHLVLVTAIRKACDMGPKILKPSRRLR